uniref:uncharacterized protein LOC105352734 n=1 Tax=Fragaria vesca subsp. vesca TaxID=101020 RepID=UPI0005CA6A16|nr:PREDICTED: uncharacterized protein LOC105352734 [Fragaria vesca subsp. vesca]
MVVEVLSPQDCLKHPSSHGLLSLPMKYHHRNPTPNKAACLQPDRRKPQPKPASPIQKALVPLLTGPVKILKRGEDLPKPEELPKAKENCSPPKQNQKVLDLGSTVFSGPKNPKKGLKLFWMLKLQWNKKDKFQIVFLVLPNTRKEKGKELQFPMGKENLRNRFTFLSFL